MSKVVKINNKTKSQLIKEIKEAVTEINLIKADKKKARNAETFLKEL